MSCSYGSLLCVPRMLGGVVVPFRLFRRPPPTFCTQLCSMNSANMVRATFFIQLLHVMRSFSSPAWVITASIMCFPFFVALRLCRIAFLTAALALFLALLIRLCFSVVHSVAFSTIEIGSVFLFLSPWSLAARSASPAGGVIFLSHPPPLLYLLFST